MGARDFVSLFILTRLLGGGGGSSRMPDWYIRKITHDTHFSSLFLSLTGDVGIYKKKMKSRFFFCAPPPLVIMVGRGLGMVWV